MKALYFILLLFLTNYTCFAQDIYYGPKIGVNVSNMNFSGEDVKELKENSGMKLSTHLGGFVEFAINDYFAVQPELIYTVKGAGFRTDADKSYKSAYVLKYISLPVMAKYFVKERISIEAGPQVAYLLSAKNVEINGIFSSPIGSEAAAIDLYNTTKPIDLGIVLGAGYITKSGFYFGARYEYGIFDIAKPKEGEQKSFRNGNIMLSAGFSMNY